jgi:transcriptional regulator with XRE-family HTH domain
MPNAGDAIKVMREAHNLTLSQLSHLSGVSEAHLSRIERGLRNPSPHTFSAITQALGRHMAGGEAA